MFIPRQVQPAVERSPPTGEIHTWTKVWTGLTKRFMRARNQKIRFSRMNQNHALSVSFDFFLSISLCFIPTLISSSNLICGCNLPWMWVKDLVSSAKSINSYFFILCTFCLIFWTGWGRPFWLRAKRWMGFYTVLLTLHYHWKYRLMLDGMSFDSHDPSI